jgi:DNA-binding MarR family transcriptional regulator
MIVKETKPLDFISPIHKAGRQVSVYLGKALSHFDVAPGELHLLNYLRLYGPCPVSELIRVFGYKNTTMTSILDRLVKQNHIVRQLNSDDRRSFQINTTPSGNRIAKKSFRLVADFDQMIMSQISKSELLGFRKVMSAINDLTEIELRKKH